MPELPEVETVRRRIARLVTGKMITGVRVRRSDVVGYPTVSKFRSALRGRVIVQTGRRGKYLIFYLSDGRLLVIHLRLSGHLRVIAMTGVARYERIRLELSNGTALVFVEPRALGRVYLLTSGEIGRVLKGLSRMGLEPIDPGFDAEYLSRMLKQRRVMIKSVLLDQRVCAGVGNIYSDEALFRAGILPNRPANSLSRDEVEGLVRALKTVIRDGIRWLGTTMSDGRYLLPDGSRGKFQEKLLVVNRAGQACQVCQHQIARIKIGNRSSYFCPKCQH
ncbi:MAG: bifunctional DNA-formamidopyrimidine glycosylase/DNA-(apurinic or apyrimidinic site) lyase [candidate division WOR-3 bacterium]|jgi:formamidopyrimidine-DNA glycosylase